MIILNSLYSETGLLDTVKFRPGINIILGKDADKERNVNGLGKSTLVRLIDFLLLASIEDALNPQVNTFLRDHKVALELTIHGERYKIVRDFSDLGAVQFGRTSGTLLDYKIAELKEVLSNMFFLPAQTTEMYYESRWFRTLLRFFVQDDLEKYKQRDPVDFLGFNERKAKLFSYNFFLMGLPNQHLTEFADSDVALDRLRVAHAELERQIEKDTGKKVSEVRTEIAATAQMIEQLEGSLHDYEFLQNYREIEKALEDIARESSDRLSRFHALNRTLDRHRESYQVSIGIDLEQVTALYQEMDWLC